MSIIEKMKIKKICDAYKEKSLKENKYYMLANDEIRKRINNIDDLDMYKDWDDIGSIPLEVGNYLQKIINSEDYVLFGHRTAVFSEEELNSESLLDILNRGLVNNGHTLTNGSVKEELPELTETANMITNPLHMQIILKTHRKDSFGNNSTGSVLFVIPKEYINNEGNIIVNPNLVYNYDEAGIPHVKPEFIIGVTTLNDEIYQGECKFYSKEEILNNQKQR